MLAYFDLTPYGMRALRLHISDQEANDSESGPVCLSHGHRSPR